MIYIRINKNRSFQKCHQVIPWSAFQSLMKRAKSLWSNNLRMRKLDVTLEINTLQKFMNHLNPVYFCLYLFQCIPKRFSVSKCFQFTTMMLIGQWPFNKNLAGCAQISCFIQYFRLQSTDDVEIRSISKSKSVLTGDSKIFRHTCTLH